MRGFARSDEEILQEIEEDVIRKVMWLSPSSVDVTVANGIVTLSGEVASEADAELLPTFARKVPGVVHVDTFMGLRIAKGTFRYTDLGRAGEPPS